MPSYQVITNIGNEDVFEGTKEAFVEWAQSKGWQLDPQTPYENATHLKAHLQGEPKLQGFHGPMGPGPTLRYEDWKSSEFYSS